MKLDTKLIKNKNMRNWYYTSQLSFYKIDGVYMASCNTKTGLKLTVQLNNHEFKNVTEIKNALKTFENRPEEFFVME